MPRNAVLTPNQWPAEKRAFALYVPYTVDWAAILVGAVSALSPEYRWELFGTATVEDCVQVIRAASEGAMWIDPELGKIAAFVVNRVLPAKWLPCDGSVYSQSDYPDLIQVLDTDYLNLDGTFRTPDLRGRTIVGEGQGVGLTNRTANSEFGTETHALTGGQLAAHTHGMTHNHPYSQVTYPPGVAFFPGELPVLIPGAIPLPTVTGPSSALTTGNAGSGFPHPNVQPSKALRYFIKALP